MWALDVEEVVHLVGDDLLFVERAQHEERNAGVLERFRRVEFVGKRSRPRDERVGQLQSEVRRSEIHHFPFGSAGSASVRSRMKMRNRDAGKLLVYGVPTERCRLRFRDEVLVGGRVGPLDHPEARFVAKVVRNLRLGWTVVEMERRFAVFGAPRIEAVQRPDTGVDRELLLGGAVRHVVPVRNAVAVGDDERRPRVGFRFEKRLRRLRHLCAEGDLGDVDVAVHVRQQPEIFFAGRFAGGRKLGGGPERRGF